MGDEELIDAMAELWVTNGGDADGIDWCYQNLRDAVQEKQEKQESE